MKPFVALILTVWTWSASAQSPYAPPRTPSGEPDFQGVWSTSFLTPLERPEGIEDLTVSDANEASIAQKLTPDFGPVADPDFTAAGSTKLARVRGELRTSHIVEPADGKMPFTEGGLTEARRDLRLFLTGYAHPEERSTSERCVEGLLQAPIRTIPLPFTYQIVQTPVALVLRSEDVAATRIIDLSGRPAPPDAMRSRAGYSAGRWDGDILVVETTHLRADDPFRSHMGRSIIVGPDSRIIERFERASPEELVYSFTVEDPANYARPWLAEFSFTSAPHERVYEYACHEANYSLTNVLLSGRVADLRGDQQSHRRTP
jgi:hypothetical protein